MASMEHFNRQCAKASGRQHVIVEPLRPGGGADTGDVGDGGHAQLSGPDPSDPCSKIASCDDCGGKVRRFPFGRALRAAMGRGAVAD